MKTNYRYTQPRLQTQLPEVSRRRFLRSIGVSVFGVSAVGALATEPTPSANASAQEAGPSIDLNPGDILYTDSEAAIIKIDSATNQAVMVSSEGILVRPFGIALLPDGDIVVSDTGCLALIRIRCGTGQQISLPRDKALGVPFGITTDRDGQILVANGQAI